MADNREVNVILRARNAMARGISQAQESLQNFGRSVVRVGAALTAAFTAGTVAVIGFATRALAAYSRQEDAERSLVAAMNAHGEAGEALLPMLREVASRIQDQTGVADEATLATMAQGRALGVGVGQLEQYARGVVALRSAGLEGATAQRAMAAAIQGNTEMLTRYLPELRGVTDATERQRIVNGFLERGYQQQEEQLQTLSGQWNLLKGRMGDAWEEVGRGIASNGMLQSVIERVSNAVSAFTSRISDWVEGGGVTRLTIAMQTFFLDMQQRWEMARANASVFFGAIRDTTVFQYLSGIAVANFNVITAGVIYLRDLVGSAWAFIRSGGREAFEAPDIRPMLRASRGVVEALRGDGIEVTNHWQDAVNARNQLEQQHAQQIEELSEMSTEKLRLEHERREQKAREAAAAQAGIAQNQSVREVESAQKTAEEIKAIRDQMLAEQRELQQELEGLEREQERAVQDAENEKRREREQTLQEAQRLGNRRVQDVIAEAEREKQIAREVAAEDRRMQELQDAVRRGVRLSRRQAEELDAWERIQEARAVEEQMMQDAQRAAELERAEKVRIEEDRKDRIAQIRGELADLNENLGEDEIHNAENINRREGQIVEERVNRFIEGNQERRRVELANASDVIDSMEDVAHARDSLFPEAISGSVGDNVSGAISAAERFQQNQLNKLDQVIVAIETQTETLDNLLRLG